MAGLEQPAVALGAEQGEGEIDERFEYDAPRFYNFDEGSPNGAPAADGWFDTEGPKGLATPPRPGAQEPVIQGGAGGAIESESKWDQGEPQHTTAVGNSSKDTSNGGCCEWRQALGAITNKGQQHGKAAQPADKKSKRKAADAATSRVALAAATATNRDGKNRPASAAALHQQRQHKHRASDEKEETAAAASSQTVSVSPRLQLRLRPGSGQQKTSEQLKLEKVQHKEEAAAALQRRNAEAVTHVLAPALPAVAHSRRPLTEPVPLDLCTSKRRRMHSMETRSMASPFKSMAEQIAAFEGRLLGKSHLAHGSSFGEQPAAKQHLQGPVQHMAVLTVPMSPQFATKGRARPPRFKPREVVEAEEMAAMPKFKARPLNKRILQAGSAKMGLPHVGIKPPTVPEPFALKTDLRAAEHFPGSSGDAAGAAGGNEGAVFVFEAQGGGGRLTRSKTAQKKASTGQQLTQPKPFALATDARGATRSADNEAQQKVHDGCPSKRARKMAAGPFSLATDLRGAAEEARIEDIRRRQEEQALRDTVFKALPLNKAALAGTWKPAAVALPELTVPKAVVLHSEVRAVQRRQFDDAAAAHTAKLEAGRQRLQELQQQQEQEGARRVQKEQRN